MPSQDAWRKLNLSTHKIEAFLQATLGLEKKKGPESEITKVRYGANQGWLKICETQSKMSSNLGRREFVIENVSKFRMR